MTVNVACVNDSLDRSGQKDRKDQTANTLRCYIKGFRF